MFKRWCNSGLNTCHGMLEQLREMTQRWLTSKHVCASHWAWGSQARIADAQSEDQTDLTAQECEYFPKMPKYFLPIFLEYFWQILLDSSRVRIFPKNAQIFLTNISRIFLTNITWQLESANISQTCLPSSASWWILKFFLFSTFWSHPRPSGEVWRNHIYIWEWPADTPAGQF